MAAGGATSGGFPLVAAISAIKGSNDSRAMTRKKTSALSLVKLWQKEKDGRRFDGGWEGAFLGGYG